MDKIIIVKASGQKLTGSGLCSVNRTVGLMYCEFEFDSTWNDYPVRTANFKRDSDPMSEAVTRVLINGKCRVPDELLKFKGTISVALQGENTDGQVERTAPLKIIQQTQTITDGRNAIDPSPDQYTEFIERAGEAIEGYFEEHKEEFKGDPGEPGAPGDDYVLTQEDREEIAGIAVEEIQPALNKKMEYYAVTIENGHMTHNGEVQTYADILNAFNDQSVFLYLSYLNLIFIPSFVVAGHEEEGRDAVEFASAYYYAEEPTIARVIINSAEQIKYDQIALENTDWKTDDLTGWTIGEYPQAYPTADAVATQFDNVKKDLSEKADQSELVDVRESLNQKADKSELDGIRVDISDLTDRPTLEDATIMPSLYLNATTGNLQPSTMGDSGATSLYIECEPNTTYIIKKLATKVFRVGTTSAVPVSGVKVDGYINIGESSEIIYTTSDNAHYLVINYYINTTQALPSSADVLASIKFGATAKDYTARSELDNKVGFTDYASSGKAGIVRPNGSKGFLYKRWLSPLKVLGCYRVSEC